MYHVVNEETKQAIRKLFEEYSFFEVTLDWEEAVKVTKGLFCFNNFQPEFVASKIKHISKKIHKMGVGKTFPDKICWTIGREGSPLLCLEIYKGSDFEERQKKIEKICQSLAKEIQCDIHEIKVSSNSRFVYKFWWD